MCVWKILEYWRMYTYEENYSKKDMYFFHYFWKIRIERSKKFFKSYKII